MTRNYVNMQFIQFLSALTRNDMKYFSNMQILKESENISECELELYINNPDKLGENFKIRFGDLENMHAPEWFATPFDANTYSRGYESDMDDERIEMHVDITKKTEVTKFVYGKIYQTFYGTTRIFLLVCLYISMY